MNDFLGKSMTSLKKKQLFLLDMDGTIYLDHTLFPGTLPFLDAIKKAGKRAIYITNNSSKSVADYVRKLQKMGIAAESNDFFTSSMAMAKFLNEHYHGKTVYCMGTESLIRELQSAGVSVRCDTSAEIDVVVLGYDTELTYQKLYDVSKLLQKDLPYLATNPDYVCPVEFGYAPDCGAMAELLRHAVHKMPIFLGKPNPTILLQAMEKCGYQKEDTVVIGDRLYTDIQSGINAGVTTVCVLSGECTLQEIEQSAAKPDFVVSSISEIWKQLTEKE
jgi:HAD superfamily hydrolase (TIGR01450 family)